MVPPRESAPGVKGEPEKYEKPRADTADKQSGEGKPDPVEGGTRDAHLKLIENPFTKVEGINALSTFAVDVDTASYAIVRKFLSTGTRCRRRARSDSRRW